MKPLYLIALLALTGCGLGSSTARWWRSTHPPKPTPEQVQFMREQAEADARWRATNGYPKFYTNAQGQVDKVEWFGGDYFQTNRLRLLRHSITYPTRSVIRVADSSNHVFVVAMSRTNHPPWNTNWTARITDNLVHISWASDFAPTSDHQYYGVQVLTNLTDIALWEADPRTPLPWALVASNLTAFSFDLAGQHTLTISASYGRQALFRAVARDGGW